MTAILLCGSDRFAIDQALSILLKGAGVHTIVKNPAKLAQTLAPSFFTEKRLVCLDGIDSWKDKEQELVQSYLKNPDPSITLVIIALKASSELSKCCSEVQEFEKQAPWEKEANTTAWIQAFFAERAVKIQPKLCQKLAASLSGDFHGLVNELEKLCTYVKDEVTEQDIAAVSTLWSQHSLWQLSDAVISANSEGALSCLYSILKQDLYVLVVVRHLRSAIHQLLDIGSRIDAGQPRIAEHYPKLKGRLFEKAYANAERLGSKRLKQALFLIDGTEAQLKDSPFDETALLQTLILKLRSALSTA